MTWTDAWYICDDGYDGDDDNYDGDDDGDDGVECTFCPAATVPLAGSTAKPRALASAGTSHANSPGSFAPQFPITSSEAAAAPELSPTAMRRVLALPTGDAGVRFRISKSFGV